MVGIVLISHGRMAEGIFDAAEMFLTELPQTEVVSLMKSDSPEDFARRLKAAVAHADTGEGVIILADMKGGTPCNQAAKLAGEKVRVIAGMNLPLVMELLLSRDAGEPLDGLVKSALELAKEQMMEVYG